VRFLNNLARLLLILAALRGAPGQYAFATGGQAYDLVSPLNSVVGAHVLHQRGQPASIPLHAGALPAGVVLPAPVLSGGLDDLSGLSVASAVLSSLPARAPPLNR
jgi:hypothetical protein